MDETNRRWRQQIERRLNELGSQTKGNQSFQADRIVDVVEQIDELRQELRAVSERLAKMAAWLKKRERHDSTQKEVADGES